MPVISPSAELLAIPASARNQFANLVESGALSEFINTNLVTVLEQLPAGEKLEPKLAQLIRGCEVEL